MKLTKSLIIVIIGSATLWAQAPANAPAKAPQKKPAAAPAKAAPATQKPSQATTHTKGSTALPATVSAKPAAAKQPTAASKSASPASEQKKPAVANKAPAKPAVAKQAASQPAPGPKKSAAPEKKPAVAVSEAKPAIKEEGPKTLPRPTSLKEAGSSRVSAMAGRRDPFVSPIVRASGAGPVCETGKRCLMVDQIQLKGIVKSPNGFIAVVENPMKRAYFLRENDPVFNGTVVRITGDTVIFREATTDKLGKQSTREVVKKVNAPVV